MDEDCSVSSGTRVDAFDQEKPSESTTHISAADVKLTGSIRKRVEKYYVVREFIAKNSKERRKFLRSEVGHDVTSVLTVFGLK